MNPFSYQGPVEPDRLIDRRTELDSLQRAAGDRVAIRLAAPRRFGKTSVLDAHVAAMRAVGHRAVRVDLSKVATVGDVAARFAEAFGALPADPRHSVRRWMARLSISAGVPGLGVRLAPSAGRPAADEARVALLELLDVPLRLHQAGGGLTVVCMDEFQDLLVADDALDGLVRSVIQHHGEAAAYVFAGSQPSLMRALFSDQERPFYGQARPLELPRLPLEEATRDIDALLSADRLEATGAVDELMTFTQGHPQRTLLLAHHLYNLLEEPRPTDDLAAAAIDLALDETRDAQQALWDGLGRVERIVLMALADGQAVSGSTLAAEHRIARSTLREALERLLTDERHVQRDDHGTPFLLDPLFAEWLRRR
ncbi:MAG: AAA family ATPase [Solirubrobacteraceae bacterium]